jgi:hypothetical protein
MIKIDQIGKFAVKVCHTYSKALVPEGLTHTGVHTVAGLGEEIWVPHQRMAQGKKTRQLKPFSCVHAEGRVGSCQNIRDSDARAGLCVKLLRQIHTHSTLHQ